MARLKTTCLLGAAPDTGNRGVSALCHSILDALDRRGVRKTTVFDNHFIRWDWMRLERGMEVERMGASHRRRYHRRSNLWNMRVSNWLGGLANPGVRAIRLSDAVLDISGGDSFTDLYGERRFWAVALPKLIALEAGRPLVLLPQTYGPFKDARLRQVARRILTQASSAWARDAQSFARLREFLDVDFNAARHRCGVDMAFGLRVREPRSLPPTVGRWMSSGERSPVVGFNVSGLVHGLCAEGRERYGIRAAYGEAVARFLSWLLAETDCRVVLIPHVTLQSGEGESDGPACELIRTRLSVEEQARVSILNGDHDADELKWVISRLHWMCGTRMHATIAALSAGVPAAALAYSDKFHGIFEQCGAEDQIIDLRSIDTDDVVARLKQAWAARDDVRRRLARYVPLVRGRLERQMDEIVGAASVDLTAAEQRRVAS